MISPESLSEQLAGIIEDEYGFRPSVPLEPISPPRPWGLSSPVCLRHADEMGNPHQAAEQLAGRLADETPEQIDRVEGENGFLNIYYDPAAYGSELVEEITSGGYGEGNAKDERVMVEFSQPNTHKSFHVGHLRNALLGNTLCNVLEFAGFDVVRANYYGDIGLHVVKCLWGLQNRDELGVEREPGETEGHFLGRIYTAVSNLLNDENSAADRAEAEIREMHRAWDEGDEDLRELWRETREASLDEFARIYRDLDVKFDTEFFESELEEAGKEIVRELLDAGIAEVSDDPEYEGAAYVDLAERTGEEELGKLVVQRGDGTTLYSTKDLALAKQKFEGYDLDRSYYVVASEQKLHLRQVFAILDMMDFEYADRLEHIPYELVVLPGGKMSSREGNVVLLDELWETAEEEFARITEEKGYAEPESESARRVALGAIKYYMLAVDNNKQVVFDFEEALNPEGRSGVYLQYSYVRANRILNKAEAEPPAGLLDDFTPGEAETALLRKLDGFPGAVEKSWEELDPSPLAHYGFELAQAFSDFYNQCPVLQADDETVKRGRLAMVSAYRRVITTVCEDLLGIELPERM